MLWSRITCSSKIFKYPLAAETPASYILMYCNASSTTFTAVHCFQFKKKVLELNATLDKSSDGAVKHQLQVVSDYKMSTGSSSTGDSHLAQGGRTTMKPMPANRSFYCSEKYHSQENYSRAI